MTVRRAGSHRAQFNNRFENELRCICDQRGDRNVFVDDKGPYCIIIDREYEKIDIEDVGINSTTIEAIWLDCDQIPIRNKSIISSGGKKYKVSNSPIDKHDGWRSAKLQLLCEC